MLWPAGVEGLLRSTAHKSRIPLLSAEVVRRACTGLRSAGRAPPRQLAGFRRAADGFLPKHRDRLRVSHIRGSPPEGSGGQATRIPRIASPPLLDPRTAAWELRDGASGWQSPARAWLWAA